MDYYWVISGEQPEAVCLMFEESELGFCKYDMDSQKDLGVEKLYCLVEPRNGGEDDYICNNMNFMIVSKRARAILEECNIGECRFIPVHNKEDEALMGYAVHCKNILPAWDEKNSVYSKVTHVFADGEVYEHNMIMKYAVRIDRLNNSDLFKLEEDVYPCFVSGKLKKKLEAIHARGFGFKAT